MRLSIFLTCCLFVCPAQLSAAKWIEITQQKSKKSLRVEVLALQGSLLKVKTQAGKKYTVPLHSLTRESVNKVRYTLYTQQREASEKYRKINQIVGRKLFQSSSLWDEPASQVASRLGLPQESNDKVSSSYRSYSSTYVSSFGAPPYCETLYGDADGVTKSLSFVYANKADYASLLARGALDLGRYKVSTGAANPLEAAIRSNAQQVEAALTKALGKSSQQYYGEKEDRRRVQRWDFGEHAFLLSEVTRQYKSLLVVPAERADKEGRAAFIKDEELRKLLEENVTRKKNGDVVLANVPQVNEGPYGYSALACLERVLRYMKVPTEMHLLFSSVIDEREGLVYLDEERCKRLARSKARKLTKLDLKSELDIKLVREHIDQGLPIVWRFRSSKTYESLINSRSARRRKLVSLDSWRDEISAEAQTLAPRLGAAKEHNFTSMIVGYNAFTQEVAISDSGRSSSLRWLHVSLAKSVTNKGGFVIDL